MGVRDLGERKWGTSHLKMGTNTGDLCSHGVVLYLTAVVYTYTSDKTVKN